MYGIAGVQEHQNQRRRDRRHQKRQRQIGGLAEAEIRDKQNADRQHQQMQPDQKVSAAERCKDEQQRQSY